MKVLKKLLTGKQNRANMQPAIAFEILLFGAGMTKKDIAKTVRELRKVLGLTQEQFAAKVGVSFSTVNRWENGKGKPSPLAMKQIKELSKLTTKSLREPLDE